jgi:hypothetical protein
VSRRRKLAGLNWRERVMLLQSLLLLPVAALGVKFVGVQRFRNALVKLSRNKQDPSADRSFSAAPAVVSLEDKTQAARKIARLVRAAANHGLYRANCLEQSLVLWFMLERNGLESKIRFGARKEDAQLQAHAWIECQGIALNEDRSVEQRYAPFAVATASTPVKSR